MADEVWWQQQLPILRDRLRSFLSRTLSARFADWQDHNDLISETILQLYTQFHNQSEKYPPSWFSSSPPPPEEQALFYGLATTICKRVVANLFRSSVIKWSQSKIDIDNIDYIPDEEITAAEKRIMLIKMLQICTRMLAQLPPEDAEILAYLIDKRQVSLDARQRKRLERLRHKLKEEVTSQLGEAIAELLK